MWTFFLSIRENCNLKLKKKKLTRNIVITTAGLDTIAKTVAYRAKVNIFPGEIGRPSRKFRFEHIFGKPITAIFNKLIYIQFSIYIYVIFYLFIQFNIYIYAIFLNPFNSIAQYSFNLIRIFNNYSMSGRWI